MLQSRLDKIGEIQDSLPDCAARLKTLEDHVSKASKKIPSRARENMERDLTNLK